MTYTPGYSSWAHPMPQDTTPTCAVYRRQVSQPCNHNTYQLVPLLILVLPDQRASAVSLARVFVLETVETLINHRTCLSHLCVGADHPAGDPALIVVELIPAGAHTQHLNFYFLELKPGNMESERDCRVTLLGTSPFSCRRPQPATVTFSP